MTPERCAAWLLHGEIPARRIELDDDAFREDVVRRLARCGLALRRGVHGWMAVARDARSLDGAHPTWSLRVDETVLLLQLWALLERARQPTVSRTMLIDVAVRTWGSREYVERFVLPTLVRRGLIAEDAGRLGRGVRFAVIDSEMTRDQLVGIDVLLAPDA